MATLAPQGHADQIEMVIPTPRERSLLRLIWLGYSVKQMVEELSISPNTIHQYVVGICRTLGVSTRPELQAWIAQHPECLIPNRPVEWRFHRAPLPDSPDTNCPCLWCSALRAGMPEA